MPHLLSCVASVTNPSLTRSKVKPIPAAEVLSARRWVKSAAGIEENMRYSDRLKEILKHSRYKKSNFFFIYFKSNKHGHYLFFPHILHKLQVQSDLHYKQNVDLVLFHVHKT